MTKALDKANSRMLAHRAENALEPAVRDDEPSVPIEASKEGLIASLERGSRDLEAGRVKRVSVAELKADMRADFERITGYKIA